LHKACVSVGPSEPDFFKPHISIYHTHLCHKHQHREHYPAKAMPFAGPNLQLAQKQRKGATSVEPSTARYSASCRPPKIIAIFRPDSTIISASFTHFFCNKNRDIIYPKDVIPRILKPWMLPSRVKTCLSWFLRDFGYFFIFLDFSQTGHLW